MPDVVVVGGGHNGLVCAGLPGQGRAVGHGRRAPPRARRGRGDRGSSRVQVFRLLLRRLPAAPGNHPGTEPGAPRADPAAAGRDVHAAARRLSLAARGPRAKHAEIARHSRRDADAYEDFTATMRAMAAFAKPLLGMIPPDPNAIDLRGLLDAAGLGQAFRRLGARRQHLLIQLLSSSASISSSAGSRASRSRPRSPRRASSAPSSASDRRAPPTCCCTTTWARSTAPSRSWGLPRGTGAVSMAIAGAATEAGAVLRTSSPVARILVEGGTAVGVMLESGEEIGRRRSLERRPAGHVRAPGRPRAAPGGLRRHRARLSLPRRDRQGQPRARRLSRFHLPAGSGPTCRGHLDLAEPRVSRAGL